MCPQPVFIAAPSCLPAGTKLLVPSIAFAAAPKKTNRKPLLSIANLLADLRAKPLASAHSLSRVSATQGTASDPVPPRTSPKLPVASANSSAMSSFVSEPRIASTTARGSHPQTPVPDMHSSPSLASPAKSPADSADPAKPSPSVQVTQCRPEGNAEATTSPRQHHKALDMIAQLEAMLDEKWAARDAAQKESEDRITRLEVALAAETQKRIKAEADSIRNRQIADHLRIELDSANSRIDALTELVANDSLKISELDSALKDAEALASFNAMTHATTADLLDKALAQRANDKATLEAQIKGLETELIKASNEVATLADQVANGDLQVHHLADKIRDLEDMVAYQRTTIQVAAEIAEEVEAQRANDKELYKKKMSMLEHELADINRPTIKNENRSETDPVNELLQADPAIMRIVPQGRGSTTEQQKTQEMARLLLGILLDGPAILRIVPLHKTYSSTELAKKTAHLLQDSAILAVACGFMFA
eukprot:m51a1_g9504 hypothetical protein (481) ;mRNA; f:676821-678594